MSRFARPLLVLLTGCNVIFDIDAGQPRPICADALLIDDLEDGNRTVCASNGRDGHWFAFGDGTVGADLIPTSDAEFEPTRIDDGSREPSRYAARFSGSGFETWGAIMGTNLVSRPPYDAVGMGGISFWMRSIGPVDVLMGTSETSPTNEGGTCEDPRVCNEHFRFSITAPAPGWAEYHVPFNALRQFVDSVVWNPRHLTAILIQTPAAAPFDVWIDDLRFYDCAGPECQPTCSDPRFPTSCRTMGSSRSSCQPPDKDCATVASSCSPPLIDDFEDGDAEICVSEERQGQWYVIGDGTSTELEPANDAWLPSLMQGPRGASHRAAHVRGAGFSSWGARMGLELNTRPTGAVGYDASAADGVSFWMKSAQPVAVELQLLSTILQSQGGNCDESAEGAACNDHFKFWITTPSIDWVEYELPFSLFARDQATSVTGAAAWDPTQLRRISFHLPAPDFDIWIDDLRFYSLMSP